MRLPFGLDFLLVLNLFLNSMNSPVASCRFVLNVFLIDCFLLFLLNAALLIQMLSSLLFSFEDCSSSCG